MYNYDGNPNTIAQQKKHYETQRKQQSYFQRLKFVLIVTLVGVSGYLFDQRPAVLTANKALLALGIIWVSLIPALQYLSDRQRPPIPFLPLVGIFYATSFGLPMFSAGTKVHYLWSLENVSEKALLLTLIGVVAINIAFYCFKYSVFQKIPALKLSQSYSITKLIILLWVLLILHTLFIYIPFIREIPSVGQFLDPTGYIAYGMFYILYKRGYLPFVQSLILLGIFLPAEILTRFASGALAQLMILGLYMVIIIFQESKRIPIFLITGILIFFFLFNPVKGEFRTLTWGNPQMEQSNPIQKAKLFINVVIEYYSSSKFTQKSDRENTSLARTAHILVFSAVVEDTPNRVPYWGGQTYLPLVTSWIPRAIFPDKPTENTGNQFGRRYKYLGSTDFTTSFNLPWIVEMYANFGQVGVLIGMSLVGILLAFLEQTLNHSNMNPLEFVIGSTILFRLVYQESNFSLMTGSVLTLFLSFYLLFKFLLTERR
jgi:hypothetical protein